MASAYVQIFSLLLVLCTTSRLLAAPLSAEDASTSTEVDGDDGNSTEELYVIRAVVYEVGILTTEDNSTDQSQESHEEVSLTFYDPQHNGSVIDLSNIPMPLQTNVSGQVITGVAPVNLGSVQLPGAGNTSDVVYTPAEDVSSGFTLPNALVSVTRNVSTTDQEHGNAILQGLPPLLGLQQHFQES